MSAAVISFRAPVLPWTMSAADEERFRRIAATVVLAAAVFGVVLPWLPHREPDRSAPPPLPAPMARLLLEDKPVPPPPPPPAAATKPVSNEPATQPTPAPKAATPEKMKQAPVPEARNPVPGRAPGEEAARRRASGVGLLAMKNELQQMTGAPLAVQLQPEVKPGPGVGVSTGPGVGAGTEPGVPLRSMITAAAGRGSGGVNTAGYSRDTGGGGLAGRSTTLVEGVAGGGGGGGPGGGGGSAKGGGGVGGGGAPHAAAHPGGTLTKGGSGKASRSIEEIKLVFERHKGAIYALYNRALRDDPSLQGKVVLQLTIAPSGAVTDLRIVSSELHAAELEGKLLARVRQFDFGAKEVDVMVVSWPVDFLPS